jgi:hypothetical protein
MSMALSRILTIARPNGTQAAASDLGRRLYSGFRFLRGQAALLRLTRIVTDPGHADVLVKAIEAAAQHDIYWSNEFFYRWLDIGGPPGGAGTTYHAKAAPQELTAEGRRFQLVIQEEVSAESKLACLRELACKAVLPGAGVAYARVLAKRGVFHEALEVARKSLLWAQWREADAAAQATANPSNGAAGSKSAPRQYELHVIENQIFALERMIAGKTVFRALKRYLGDDDGYLKARTCHFPFERMDIQENGNCAVCCAQWMPRFSTGNVLSDGVSALDVFRNDRSAAARQSMLDGSFKFCDLVKCPVFANDSLSIKEAAVRFGENTRNGVERGAVNHEYPSYVLLAFDQSCNLSCPSCRSHVITEKMDMQTRKEELIGTSIAPLLKKANVLHINPAGELFVSRPLRRLLSKLNRQDYPDLKLNIISNGMLLNQREWDKFQSIHGMVDSIRISTDAATKPTFEKLRRGGRWEIFYENLKFLAGLKDRGEINEFKLSFTYQVDNFREMPAFVDMCRDLTPHAIIIFEKLENWGTFKPEDYTRMAVHKMDHPLHEEFLAIIGQPKMKVVPPRLYADYSGFL